MTNIPVLFICHNRLEYTKKAIEALCKSDAGDIFIIDNSSSDGTQDWLDKTFYNGDPFGYWVNRKINISYQTENIGISGAMNIFLNNTQNYRYVSKIDNDTIIPEDFFSKMQQEISSSGLDLLQAKHFIIPATNKDGWGGFIKTMKKGNRPGIYLNHFIGGSGIIFYREKVSEIPNTDWVLGSWREFQRLHPELKKGFTENVEIKLLDEQGYDDFPNYYKQTGRTK